MRNVIRANGPLEAGLTKTVELITDAKHGIQSGQAMLLSGNARYTVTGVRPGPQDKVVLMLQRDTRNRRERRAAQG